MTTNHFRAESGVRRLLAQPISRLLVLSFVLVAVVPLVFFGIRLYKAAWDSAWREIYEKHRLLAMNLAAPISIYVNDHRAALGLLAATLGRLPTGEELKRRRDAEIASAHAHLSGFRSLTLVDRTGRTLFSTDPAGNSAKHRSAFARDRCFLRSRRTGGDALSGIERSPLTGKPTLILSQAVTDRHGKTVMVLLGELRTDLIDKLRRNIHFGQRGHSAIVDQFGRVIAHPNPEWMRTMRDLSGWPIVKKMMAGQTGVTEFYSPFVKQEMVAGYAAVPKIGWGIMVPQPKSEIEAHVRALLYPEFAWGLFGLGLAVVLGIALTRWIASPLDRLVRAALELVRNGFEGRLAPVPATAPREVRQLSNAFGNLFIGLQESRAQFDKLNRSLQHRVDDATDELRRANIRLQRLAREDHLTGLANRRYFEAHLAACFERRRSEDASLCLILIDVDNFKQINDQYGHAAGDAALVQLSALLQKATRKADLIARYGGDEFVVSLHCGRDVGYERAQEILRAIEGQDFRWHGGRVRITVSIGLLCRLMHELSDAESLLQQVDKALYRAKEAGRNCVVEVSS